MPQIRAAHTGDLDQMLAIYAPFVTGTSVSFEYEVPSQQQFLQRFQETIAQFPWIVWEEDGEVGGFAYASTAFSRAAYQWDCDLAIYVHPKFHRRGIASALYRILEELLLLQGYYNVYAIVTGNNHKSAAFHEARGYGTMAVFPNSGYKLGEWLDVTWYHKVLQPCAGEPTAPISFPQLPEKQVREIFESIATV